MQEFVCMDVKECTSKLRHNNYRSRCKISEEILQVRQMLVLKIIFVHQDSFCWQFSQPYM